MKQKTGAIGVCASAANIGPDFDIFDDWYCSSETGTGGAECTPYSNWDTEVRSLCSDACVTASQHDELIVSAYNCEDTNWTGFSTGLWTPDSPSGSNCLTVVPDAIIGDDDASEINWNLGSGSPIYFALSCSLTGDCDEEFDGDTVAWGLGSKFGGAAGVFAANTRQADFHSSTTNTTLTLDMDSGTGAGYDDTRSLNGYAEYSASECGDDICPFYLAAFKAGNMEDDWNIWLNLSPIMDEPKVVKDVQIEALTSTYAVWRPSTGDVAFFPGTLAIRIGFTVESNCVTCSGYGDGDWEFSPVVNDAVVYGHYDLADDSFELLYDFPVPNGAAAVDSNFAVDGGPPVASLNLGGSVRCDTVSGYSLSSDDLASTDPDNDIEGHLWIVDGVPRSHGHVLPVGDHVVEVLAIDSRGARDYDGPHNFEVLSGPACE